MTWKSKTRTPFGKRAKEALLLIVSQNKEGNE